MSAPNKPSQQKTLPLTDPNNVAEVFTYELSGIQCRNGTAHLTFSVVRPKHSKAGAHANSSDHERVVTSRLVMPMNVLEALAQASEQVKNAMKLNQMTGDQEQSPN